MSTRWTTEDIKKIKHKGATNMVDDYVIGRIETTTKRKNRKHEQKLQIQTIKGVCPSKSNCYRIGNKGLFKTNALTKYEEYFMWQCNVYRNENISVPFELYVNVFYPSKRSDLDNSLKIILDCLQKVKAITNDNNCCKIVAQKFIDKENPRIEFKIKTNEYSRIKIINRKTSIIGR